MSTQSGQLILQDYEIIKQAGKGAYGIVYKVRSKIDKAIYALKTIDISKMEEKSLTNTLNEIRILCSIDHPNIVGYKEAFLQDNKMCVVMEFVGGGDLSEKIAKCRDDDGLIDEETIWKYAVQILNGLKVLHNLKIMHRDIKSANIFLSDDHETVKLGDLNIAKVAKDDYASTQIGTPYYLAPEIWLNERYDYRCDVFSLGCVMYEMAALGVPFHGKSIHDLLRKITTKSAKRLPEEYSDQLEEIVRLFMEKNPANRPTVYQALEHPAFKVRADKYFRTLKSEDSGEMCILIKTIDIPKNLNLLNDNLPKRRLFEMIKPELIPQPEEFEAEFSDPEDHHEVYANSTEAQKDDRTVEVKTMNGNANGNDQALKKSSNFLGSNLPKTQQNINGEGNVDDSTTLDAVLGVNKQSSTLTRGKSPRVNEKCYNPFND